jgi:NADH-ubiquinone oxidoreductase chain 2
MSSLLGLTQFRIKRLYAYSTISHIGFILLALSINSVESIQAFFFYILQYSVSNLNAFIILITIGYSFLYLYKEKTAAKDLKIEEYSHKDLNSDSSHSPKKDRDLPDKKVKYHLPETSQVLKDINLSPIQLISQIKGYFYINPLLSISLAITLYSFIGVPPLIGFFAKQMILSAAIDNGYIFMSLIAILTSVISAVYYLVVIRYIFFEKNEYEINNKLTNLDLFIHSTTDRALTIEKKEKMKFDYNNIVLSSSLTSNISIFTLIILLFIFIPNEIISLSSILSIVLFDN